MSEAIRTQMVDECLRQEESCRYTAAALYEWQKEARFWRTVFIVAPIVLGGIATSQILTNAHSSWGPAVGAIASLLAGFFPAIYQALGMSMHVHEIGKAASEFTNLRDRFRQLALIRAHGPVEEFQVAFEQLMDRMDRVRTTAPPVPERCFRKGQRKIKAGDYEFDSDAAREAKD